AFVYQRRTTLAGDGKVLGQEVFQAIMTQRLASCCREYGIRRLAVSFSEPLSQNCNSVFAQWGAALFTAFAYTLHVRSRAQYNLLTAKAREFGGAQACLHGQ